MQESSFPPAGCPPATSTRRGSFGPRVRRLVVGWIAAGLLGGVAADEPPAPDEDDAVPVVDAGATVDVKGEVLEADAPDVRLPTAWSTKVAIRSSDVTRTDLGAILGRAPSVGIRRTGAPGTPVTASLRGSAADQVVITLGGLPLTPPGGGAVDLSAVPPSLLGGARITRGTDAALHGAGALGGAIHLEPRGRAGDGYGALLRGDTLESAGAAAWVYGEERQTRYTAGADVHLSRGRFAYERQRTPNLPDAPWTLETREHDGLGAAAGLFAAEADAGGGVLGLLAFAGRQRRAIGGRVGLPTPGASSLEGRLLVGGLFEADPVAGGRIRWTSGAWMSADTYAYDPGDPPASGAGSAFDHRRQVLGARGSVEALLAGTFAALSVEASQEILEGSDVSAARPALALTATDTAFLLSERVVVHGALRLDLFGGQRAALSPRAGARIALPAGFALAANAGGGVRIPTLFELYGETALVASNPDLRPESARTIDTGIEHAGDRHRLRFAAWQTRYRDLVVWELYPPMRIRPFNVEGARVRGVETEVAARPVTWLELSAAHTYTDARNLRPRPNEEDRLLSYRPPHRGVLRADATFGRFALHGDLEAQSAMPRNRANTRWIPGRVLVGAGAHVELVGGVSAGLHLSNLLDDRRLEDLFGYPLPGRTAFFVVRVDEPRAP